MVLHNDIQQKIMFRKSKNVYTYKYNYHILYKHASIFSGSFCLGTLFKNHKTPNLRTSDWRDITICQRIFFWCVPWHGKLCEITWASEKQVGKSPLSSPGNAQKIPDCLPEPLFFVQGKDATQKRHSHIQNICSLELRMLRGHPKTNCLKTSIVITGYPESIFGGESTHQIFAPEKGRGKCCMDSVTHV